MIQRIDQREVSFFGHLAIELCWPELSVIDIARLSGSLSREEGDAGIPRGCYDGHV